jgi:hypothetical protein
MFMKNNELKIGESYQPTLFDVTPFRMEVDEQSQEYKDALMDFSWGISNYEDCNEVYDYDPATGEYTVKRLIALPYENQGR